MAWLSGYGKRKTVSITGQSGAGTNYQVKFSIGSTSGGDFHLEGHALSFPHDIRFTDNDQTTQLDYWIEDLTVDPISVWVEVADDLGSNVDICCYYGKAGDTTTSNGDATFLFFDDFLGSSVDTEKWTVTNAPTVADSIITLDNNEKIVGKSNYGIGYACRSKTALFSPSGTGPYAVIRFRSIADGEYGSYFDSNNAYQGKYKTLTYHTTGATETIITSDSSYHIRDINKISSTLSKFYIDAALVATHTTNIGDGAGPLELRGDGAGWISADWVLVRKCIATEPAFSSAGAEESAPVAPTAARSFGVIF